MRSVGRTHPLFIARAQGAWVEDADGNRFGFTYYTVHGPFMAAFAPVIVAIETKTSNGTQILDNEFTGIHQIDDTHTDAIQLYGQSHTVVRGSRDGVPFCAQVERVGLGQQPIAPIEQAEGLIPISIPSPSARPPPVSPGFRKRRRI